MRQPSDCLIVALDFDGVDRARATVERLAGIIDFYKVGLELAYAPGGLDFAAELVRDGAKLFIDLKLHDIPNTVERATRQIVRLGATFLTVHAYPQTLAAAKRGAAESGLKVLGVTVLTSYDDADIAQTGSALGVADLVASRAAQARDAGIDGLVLSPHELAATRALLGPRMTLVSPGVRPTGAAFGDQKRVMTPAEAIDAGANHLVVGRPITQAPDPQAAAATILREIAAAVAERERRHTL